MLPLRDGNAVSLWGWVMVLGRSWSLLIAHPCHRYWLVALVVVAFCVGVVVLVACMD
jgi:hypothetical protein